jgi:hypothetical protein
MSTSCPACGVAVVPGYVRCPKCHQPLPAVKRGPTVAGGTAVETRRAPLLPLIGGGVILLGVILFFVLRDGDAKPADAKPVSPQAEETTETAAPATPAVPAIDTEADTEDRANPIATAAELDRALDQRRLWSTVEVIGDDVEVVSGSCRDPNMLLVINAARTALRDAGLTRLRCVANSGAVVFEREL